MGKFEFKSQICTTIEQSERLLELGLNKETADLTLHYERATEDYNLQDIPFSRIMHLRDRLNKRPILGRSGDDLYAKDLPAWSLHRLFEMLYADIGCIMYFPNAYDKIIVDIEDCIRRGTFNKDYMEERK